MRTIKYSETPGSLGNAVSRLYDANSVGNKIIFTPIFGLKVHVITSNYYPCYSLELARYTPKAITGSDICFYNGGK